jgi:hypothetical protein
VGFGRVVLVAGLCAVVGGCGGSDTLTRSELTSKAATICKPVAALDDTAMGPVLKARKFDPQAFADVLSTKLLPAFDRQTAALAKLDPPSDLQGAYDRYLDSVRKLSAKLKADPSAPLKDGGRLFGDSNAKGKAAGLPDVCLAGGPPPGSGGQG